MRLSTEIALPAQICLLYVCVYMNAEACACVCAYVCMYSAHTPMQANANPRVCSSVIISLFKSLFTEPRALIQLTSPRESPVSTFPALGLQAHTAVPGSTYMGSGDRPQVLILVQETLN